MTLTCDPGEVLKALAGRRESLGRQGIAMKSDLLRQQRRRVYRQHRERAAGMPAHVGAPLTFAGIAIALSAVAAHWLDLPTLGVIVVVSAVTVVAALAARSTVSSLAVGAGVLLAQPYRAGDQVRVYVPALRRTVDAEVVRVGAANTTLLVRDADGASSGVDSLVVVPNNRMLRAS
jgi:hypothetical protein